MPDRRARALEDDLAAVGREVSLAAAGPVEGDLLEVAEVARLFVGIVGVSAPPGKRREARNRQRQCRTGRYQARAPMQPRGGGSSLRSVMGQVPFFVVHG
ncbi:MAG: hypothetical protein LAN18_16805 [Acidobacteriia bacterium]|nr:hypothetical protein [Terriglobia bacterium]